MRRATLQQPFIHFRRERRERRRPELEVRLIAARSLEVLKARHPEYFSEGGT
jgi:hypothetical protein